MNTLLLFVLPYVISDFFIVEIVVLVSCAITLPACKSAAAFTNYTTAELLLNDKQRCIGLYALLKELQCANIKDIVLYIINVLMIIASICFRLRFCFVLSMIAIIIIFVIFARVIGVFQETIAKNIENYSDIEIKTCKTVNGLNDILENHKNKDDWISFRLIDNIGVLYANRDCAELTECYVFKGAARREFKKLTKNKNKT